MTRTSVARHGSQRTPPPPRPSSSGETGLLPYRQPPPPRRTQSHSQPTSLEEFRSSRHWPPKDYRSAELTPEVAEDLICAGASTFKGYWDEIPNAPPGYNRFYAVMETEHSGRMDRSPFQHDAYRDISLNMTGPADSAFPWISLEQPCMAYAFGRSPGTTTLNYWVSKHGSSYPPVKFSGAVKPRKLKLLQILERLAQLEKGLELDVSQPTPLHKFHCRVLT